MKVPSNATPQVERIIKDLKKKNDAKPFIEAFVAKHGYPLWQYAKTTQPKRSPSIYASQQQEELLEVPIVKDMTEYVNGILNVKIDANILYKLFERNAWETYGFNKAPERPSPSADDVVRKIMEHEKEIWAEDMYKISDNRLFDYWPSDITKPASFYLRSNITVDGITVIYLYEECEWAAHGEIENGVEPGGNISYAPETGLCLLTTIIIDDNPWAGGGDAGWIDFPGGSINSSNTGSWDNGGGAGGAGAGATSEGPCDPDVKWTRLEVRNSNQLFNPCLEEVIYLNSSDEANVLPDATLYGMNIVDDFPSLTNQQEWNNSIDPTGLNDYPFLLSILNAIKNSSTFRSTIENFTGTNATGNIKFRTNTLTDIADVARTIPSVARQQSTIEFSLSLLARGSKSFATITFVHEMIHADFDRIFMRMGAEPSIRNTYQKVIKALGRLKRNDLEDHEFMATEYVPFLKSVFQEIDATLGLGPHYTQGSSTEEDPDYYDAMAWSGLEGTTAWNNLPSDKKQAIPLSYKKKPIMEADVINTKIMKHIFVLFSFLTIGLVSQAQYILIQPEMITYSTILNAEQSKYKIFNINCMSSIYNENFLIHFVIFSDLDGSFKKNFYLQKQLDSMRLLSFDSILLKAKTNTQIDQQREVTHFEYEGDYNKYPIKNSGYKLAIKNKDSSYIVYDDYTIAFFYQIKDFKQFVSAQNCASLINTQAIPEPAKRIKRNSDWEIDFPDTSYSDYFPNKLFLEKINSDSTYHFIRYRQLCMDCSDNYNFEFDFDKKKGITRFWYYLPASGITTKSKYAKFSPHIN